MISLRSQPYLRSKIRTITLLVELLFIIGSELGDGLVDLLERFHEA